MGRKTSKRKRKRALAAVLLLVGGIMTVAFFLCIVRPMYDQLLWKEAVTAYKTGQYDVAAVRLHDLTKRTPSNKEAYRLLAKIGEVTGNYLEAAGNWRRVQEQDGDDNEARTRLAECLLNAREYSLILKLYEMNYLNGHLDVHELLAYAEAVVMTGDKNQTDMVVEHIREAVDGEDAISFLEGLSAIKTGDYENGRQILEQLSQKKGLLRMFRWRLEVILGGVMNAHGDIDGAEAHYRRAWDIAPQLTNVLIGDFYRMNRMYKKSAEYWKKELESHPENDYPRMQLVEIYGGLGETRQLEQLRRMIEPINRSRKELLSYSDAALHFWGGEYEKTLEDLKKCLGFYDRDFYHVVRLCCLLELKQEEHLKDDMEFLRQKSMDANFMRLVIGHLHQSLQKSLAENDLKTALWYAELMWSFTHMELPEMHTAAKLLMADKYAGRYFHEALELGRFCLKFDPEDKEVLRVMMMASLGSGNFSDCVEYSKLFGDTDAEALVARGNALAFGGQWEDSAKAFDKALACDPGNVMLREYSWRLFREFGMEERMSKVEAMYVGDGRMDMLRKSCLEALHLLWKEDHLGFSSASMRIFQDLIPEGGADNTEMRYWRGVILSWNDMLDEGILELKNTLRLGRTNGLVLCELSEAYARKGRQMEALDIARGTAQLWPGWYVYDLCLRRRENEVRNQKLGKAERLKLEKQMKMEANKNANAQAENNQDNNVNTEGEQGVEGDVGTQQNMNVDDAGNQ